MKIRHQTLLKLIGLNWKIYMSSVFLADKPSLMLLKIRIRKKISLILSKAHILNNPDSAFYFARPGPFGSISAVTGNQEESLGTGPDFFQHDSPVSSSDFIQRVNSIDSPENNRNPALGYMKINFGASQSDLQDFEALELERIYVDSNQLGKGIGQLLLDKAIEIARKAGLIYIWLGVWEHNLKARRFYTKNGFVQFDQHIFTLGNDDQTDLLLKKIL